MGQADPFAKGSAWPIPFDLNKVYNIFYPFFIKEKRERLDRRRARRES
jgi:hypothetical protein